MIRGKSFRFYGISFNMLFSMLTNAFNSGYEIKLSCKPRIYRPLPTAMLLVLTAALAACASAPPPAPIYIAPEPAPIVEPIACEPEIDLGTESAMRKLALANEWHSEMRYESAFEAYESVLSEHASLLADAYALWGIIALRLDRDNPDYSREAAQTAIYVLDQRAKDALKTEAASEARLLWFSAQIMVEADVSKDKVVAENRELEAELAQRDEAIKRMRELTLGD